MGTEEWGEKEWKEYEQQKWDEGLKVIHCAHCDRSNRHPSCYLVEREEGDEL